jgi:hypothetical protein
MKPDPIQPTNPQRQHRPLTLEPSNSRSTAPREQYSFRLRSVVRGNRGCRPPVLTHTDAGPTSAPSSRWIARKPSRPASPIPHRAATHSRYCSLSTPPPARPRGARRGTRGSHQTYRRRARASRQNRPAPSPGDSGDRARHPACKYRRAIQREGVKPERHRLDSRASELRGDLERQQVGHLALGLGHDEPLRAAVPGTRRVHTASSSPVRVDCLLRSTSAIPAVP